MNTATQTTLSALLQNDHIEARTIYHMLSVGLESERIKFQAEQILGNFKQCDVLESNILQTERFLSLMRLSRLAGLSG